MRCKAYPQIFVWHLSDVPTGLVLDAPCASWWMRRHPWADRPTRQRCAPWWGAYFAVSITSSSALSLLGVGRSRKEVQRASSVKTDVYRYRSLVMQLANKAVERAPADGRRSALPGSWAEGRTMEKWKGKAKLRRTKELWQDWARGGGRWMDEVVSGSTDGHQSASCDGCGVALIALVICSQLYTAASPPFWMDSIEATCFYYRSEQIRDCGSKMQGTPPSRVVPVCIDARAARTQHPGSTAPFRWSQTFCGPNDCRLDGSQVC